MENEFIRNCFYMVELLKDKFDIDDMVYVKGLPSTYFNILDTIDHSGTISVTDLADHLNITQPNCSRSVKKIIDKGLISKHDLPEDRRIQILSLTSKGKELMETNNKLMHYKICKKLANYDNSNISEINHDIKTIINKLNKL